MEAPRLQKNRLPSNDEISLKDFFTILQAWVRYLSSEWRIIITAGIVGALLGFTYAHVKKPVYTAVCTFVLEEGVGNGGVNRYGGLSSIIGMDMVGASGGLFRESNIIGVYKSRLMLEKTLLTPINIQAKKDLLIDKYFAFNKNLVSNLDFNIPRQDFTVKHDSLIKEVVEDIRDNYLTIERSDESPNIMNIRMRSTHELFAKNFTDRIVENVNSFYTETMTQKSKRNVTSLQKQADSVRIVLNSAIKGSASALDANPNPNHALRVLQVPSQRKQIDVQATTSIYAETIKNLEVAKMALRNETPLIQIIDRPMLPLDVEKINKFAGIAAGFCVGILFSTFLLTFKRLKVKFNNERS